MSKNMSKNVSHRMPDRMPDRMSDGMPDKGQKICQMIRRKKCQIEPQADIPSRMPAGRGEEDLWFLNFIRVVLSCSSLPESFVRKKIRI